MKTLILTVILFFLTLSLKAQENAAEKNKESKFFMAFSVGPSLPVGDYGSTSLENEQAGLAKTGYNVNLNFGYQMQKNFGFASNILYSKQSVDQDALHQIDPGLSADHWQYYGITVGPMITANLTQKMLFDFKLLGGITNVNMPVFSYQGSSSEEKWASAFAVQLGADMRYNFGKKTFFLANLDYTAMKPKTTLDGSDVEQNMSAMNINVGIGFNF